MTEHVRSARREQRVEASMASCADVLGTSREWLRAKQRTGVDVVVTL